LSSPFNEAKYKALLEGLEISEILKSDLEYSGRLDSEYYKKHLLFFEDEICKKDFVKLDNVSNFLIGPFGSAFDTENYIDDGEYRYVRGQDVKPFILKDGENRYVPYADFERLKKYALKEKDILVSVVGTLGNACIVQNKDLPAIFSCKSTVIRTSAINPVYILTFLNCKYGKELLIRKERGAIQKGLNLDDLKTTIIPKFEEIFQLKVEELFYNAQKKLVESKSLYSSAETLLLETLGLSNFELSKEPVNVKGFKESFLTTGRLDAEYYQKKYEEVTAHIITQEHDILKNLVQIKKSIEPGSDVYSDEGLPFLRVADYNKFGLTEPDKKLSDVFCKENEELITKLKPKKHTILFSKDGSVGTAYMLRKDEDLITSGAILHLTMKDKAQIIPEYLTLVLNSKLVQMQAERDAGGSIILHWRISEIENVVVPVIDYSMQQQIAGLVEESFNLKKQSEQLLETAKRAVEIAIEQDEEAAMKFIKNQNDEKI
jgi:type I restriction enzyme S subunit